MAEKKQSGRKSAKSIILENFDFIKRSAEQGASEEQIYEALGICSTTWYKHKSQMPELKELIKNARTNLVLDLKSALIKRALGFEYTEKKTYIKEDENGYVTRYTEETTKYNAPDVAAIINSLSNYDDWYRDKKLYDLKAEELELKKKAADLNLWK